MAKFVEQRKSLFGGIGFKLSFDYNLDCKLDLTDFSEFAYQWLDDITLQAQETD